MAVLAEVYVAAALRVKTSLPRALHFLTVSGRWAGGAGAAQEGPLVVGRRWGGAGARLWPCLGPA